MFDFFRSLTAPPDDDAPVPPPTRPLAARRRPALSAEEVEAPTVAEHWDIWLELDSRDRVVARGGRQVR